jgi:alpha,alpha-trehalase
MHQKALFRWVLLGASWTLAGIAAPPALPPGPDEVYGELFVAVQRAQLFPDQKTFVDAVPRMAPREILTRFRAAGELDREHLRQFVQDCFLLPEERSLVVPPNQSLEDRLGALWPLLRRQPDRDVPGSSLLPLPHAYVVPGGRFREVYYWDTYFTMLGLRESGQEELIESMVENFAVLLERYGLIPNGNRTYYLSRSQPPFFALMVELLAEIRGDRTYLKYRDALRAEWAYWNDETWPSRHVVTLSSGEVLHRYYDRRDTPRPESYVQDVETADASTQDHPTIYRHLRSAAESGWDFSSRWFADGKTLPTIRTTEIVPVDLNCLLLRLERTLARAEEVAGDAERAARLRASADARQHALLRRCWSEVEGFFFDYHLGQQRPTSSLTLAGVAPLFFKVATPEQAAAVAQVIEKRFLQPGGVVTSLSPTGQQWDWPNGWAPLQWMTVLGLANYGHDELAEEIARRWIRLNRDVYQRTGRLMEKYNVVDTSLLAGGGEYDAQDGFGWTNGVLLKLLRMYPERP